MQWLHSLRGQLFGFRNTRTSKRLARKQKRRHDWRSTALRLEGLEDRLALSVSMVTDLQAYTQNSDPRDFTNVSGTMFFVADKLESIPDQYDITTELFATNGTAGGTVQLTQGGDEGYDSEISNPQELTSFNNKLFFTANNQAMGGQPVLFTSDGTVAGTVPVLAGGNAVYQPANLTVVGGKLYFTAGDGLNNKYDLWESNGTSAGTHPVRSDANAPDIYGDQIEHLTNVNGTLYFDGYDSSTGNYDLWKSDGTSSGTTIVSEFGNSYRPYDLTAVGNTLYFQMQDSADSGAYAVWTSNGTSATMVADLPNEFYQPISFGGKLFFQMPDSTDAPDTGWALWSSTTSAASAFKYHASSTPVEVEGNDPMAVMGTNLYFNGYTNGPTLWKTDGVAANNNTGTVQTTGTINYNPYADKVAVGTELYFFAYNTPNAPGGYGLWKTNGTNSGTLPVQTSGFGAGMQYLASNGTKLFFSAYDSDANGNSPHGQEPWVSDGSNAGTQMITDIYTVSYDSNPYYLTALGNEMFFQAYTNSPVNGRYLWQTDGTAANTVPVQTSTGVIPGNPGNLITVGSTLFFTGDAGNGNDLWTSGSGTKTAVELFPSGTNPFGSSFEALDSTTFANLGGTLYFGAYDAANSQYALWKSDGTAAGTTVVSDLNQPLYRLTAVGSDLYWEQYDTTNNAWALFEYNGSTVNEIQYFPGGEVFNLTAVGSNVFFENYDSTTGNYALWVSNGSTTTNLLELNGDQFESLTSFNGKLYFSAFDNTTANWLLWTSDGSVAGTQKFVGDNGQPIYLWGGSTQGNGNDDSTGADLTVVGSELYGAFLSVGGLPVLGKTDGTAAGTGVVQQEHISTDESGVAEYPYFIANDNGMAVFEGYDVAHGYELWQSDGTDAGTLLTADIAPEYPNTQEIPSSYPSYMTVAGTQVFFSANDIYHGNELWTATISPTVVTAGISGPNDGVTEQHRDFLLTANDSNSGNNSGGFSFAVDFGDGSTETVSGASGLTIDHQYALAGSYTIKVTATNLLDGVTSAAATQAVTITTTEIQNGNLAIGGVAGNNAWSITHGSSASNYAVKDNTATVYTNFVPATGEQVILYGGNGTNSYAATDVLSNNNIGTTADKFTIGNGYVVFVKPTFIGAQPGAWTVTGNKGNDTFTISGAANASLFGLSGVNSYVVSAGASLSGTINGGSGTQNKLSYSTYTTGVVVDLLTGQATAIDGFATGGISHIENVTGSKLGGDILVGDANPNILITNAGNNIVIGGSGGGDTLTSALNKGHDILIAGTTNYDSNITALQTILATWKTATSSNYATVVSTIYSSSFADPLSNGQSPESPTQTVFDSGASDVADTVNSSGVASGDWLFVHTSGGSKPNDTVNSLGSGDREDNI